MTWIISRKRACALGLAFALALLPSGLRAEGEAGEPNPQLRAFQELLARVEAAVAAGDLSAEVAAAAAQLDFDLRREMIRAEAEIAVLRLEIGNFEGAAQEQALDRLITAVTRRELVAIERIRLLEQLAGTAQCAGAGAGPVSNEVVPSAALSGAEPDPAVPLEETVLLVPPDRDRALEIAFEAQDLIEDPDP